MNIEKIKKVELHCHIDATLNHLILQQIDKGNDKYGEIITVLKKICPVTSFSEWINKYYRYIDPLISNNAVFLCILLEQYLQNLKEQNVIYSEIMLTSFLFQCEIIEEQLMLYEKFEAVAEKYRNTGMQVEFLIAIGRTKIRKKIERKIERIKKLYNLGHICGIAIAGLEEENTIKPYTDIFTELKDTGMGIEIHAGEWTGVEFIWEALEYGYANRIGHGLSMFNDPELVKYIKINNIHIEFCPTSNLLLTDMKSIKEHPIKKAIDYDINFSINTDDPGPLCCDLNNEFRIIQKAFCLNDKDFEMIKENSLKASFAEKKKNTANKVLE